LQVPNVFAWTLNPVCSALVGSFFLGSSCYFLYGLFFPRWHTACGQLWSFLAYDIVLIVPYVLHFATVSSAQLPSLIINTFILLYSGVLAIYYLLIKKDTRSRINIASLSSHVMLLLDWSKEFRAYVDHRFDKHSILMNDTEYKRGKSDARVH